MKPGFGPERTQEMMGMGRKMMERMMDQQEGFNDSHGGKNFNPVEMCDRMTKAISHAADFASYATPEVRALFEDWAAEVEKEVLEMVRLKKDTTPDEVAAALSITLDSALYFICKLIRNKRLVIKSLEFNDLETGNIKSPQHQTSMNDQDSGKG